MNPSNDLDRLALLHGSDKFGSHSYTPVYHRYFSSLRDRSLSLLELGIGGYDNPNDGGASLRMWRDYFPKGQIFGLDYFPKHGIDERRIRTFQGDQSDPRTISTILDAVPDHRLDIIVDDGSHRCEHVIASFQMLFRYVANGGWYVVEDAQTSYWFDHGGTSYDMNAPTSTVAFFKTLADGVNWREIHRPGYTPTLLDRTVTSVHFYHNLIFIEKGDNLEESNFVKNSRLPTAM